MLRIDVSSCTFFFKNPPRFSSCVQYSSSVCWACWCYFSFNNLSPHHFHSTIPLTQLPSNHIPQIHPLAPSRSHGCPSALRHFRYVTHHKHGYNSVADKCFARRHIGARFCSPSDTASEILIPPRMGYDFVSGVCPEMKKPASYEDVD